MTPAARVAAAIEVLGAVLDGAPAERELTNWARRSRFAGSGDRAAIRDIVFDSLRNLRSFQARAGFDGARALGVGWCLSQGIDPATVFTGEGHAPAVLAPDERTGGEVSAGAVAADMPDWLWARMCADMGGDAAAAVASALQCRAPVDLRVNIARVTPQAAADALAAESIVTEPVPGVPTALRVRDNARRVSGSAAYRDGLVEVQDAASQAVAAALPLAPGQTVLDYCAGGGGKTLAMAAACPGARFLAWDIAEARLAPLAERAARAGAAVELLAVQPTQPRHDIVLVDAPCSGSGAWRRSPEAKWRLTPERLQELCDTQARVLDAAWKTVRPGGVLAYATCSVLPQENAAQVAAFLARHDTAKGGDMKSFALGDPGDGFFVALLHKPA